jgi:hypothetical protein
MSSVRLPTLAALQQSRQRRSGGASRPDRGHDSARRTGHVRRPCACADDRSALRRRRSAIEVDRSAGFASLQSSAFVGLVRELGRNGPQRQDHLRAGKQPLTGVGNWPRSLVPHARRKRSLKRQALAGKVSSRARWRPHTLGQRALVTVRSTRACLPRLQPWRPVDDTGFGTGGLDVPMIKTQCTPSIVETRQSVGYLWVDFAGPRPQDLLLMEGQST